MSRSDCSFRTTWSLLDTYMTEINTCISTASIITLSYCAAWYECLRPLCGQVFFMPSIKSQIVSPHLTNDIHSRFIFTNYQDQFLSFSSFHKVYSLYFLSKFQQTKLNYLLVLHKFSKVETMRYAQNEFHKRCCIF